MKIYKDIYNSCSYLEKEWWVFSRLYLHPLHPSWTKSESLFRFLNPHLKSPLRRLHLWIQNSVSWLFDLIRHECFPVERIVPLTGYTGIVKTTHCYKKLLETDSAEAEHLCNKLQNRWDISDSSLLPIHSSNRKCWSPILDLNSSIKINNDEITLWPLSPFSINQRSQALPDLVFTVWHFIQLQSVLCCWPVSTGRQVFCNS